MGRMLEEPIPEPDDPLLDRLDHLDAPCTCGEIHVREYQHHDQRCRWRILEEIRAVLRGLACKCQECGQDNGAEHAAWCSKALEQKDRTES